MVKRAILAILAACIMMVPAASAMEWKEETPAQSVLKQYIEAVNGCLAEQGESGINRIFEMYTGIAVFGITADAGAESPEGIEITVTMYYDTLNILELRMNDTGRFAAVAASMIKALYGEQMTWEEALKTPSERVKRAAGAPGNSFKEEIDELNGTIPRVYYAYYPDQYRDGADWIQMTLVFPMAGTWDGTGILIVNEGQSGAKVNDRDEDMSEDYEGYYSEDDYSHLEVFTTPTPEPDSAAAEYDFR